MAVDEPIRVTRCLSGTPQGCMSHGQRCLTHDLWDELGQHIHLFLASMTLADIVERRVLGRARPCMPVNGATDAGRLAL